MITSPVTSGSPGGKPGCTKNVFALGRRCVEMTALFTGEILVTGKPHRSLVKTIVTDPHFWLPLVVLFLGVLLLVFVNKA